MVIFEDLTAGEITGAVGGSLGGAIILLKIFFEIWKSWKKHKEDNKTTTEAISLILKSINISKKKPNKSKKK